MSKLGYFNAKVAIFAMTVLLLFILPSTAIFAEAPTQIKVVIMDSWEVAQGENLTVPIKIHSTSATELAGFDLFIDFDEGGLSLVDVQPGQLLVDCGWEYFVYRYEPGVGLRIVALADINDGDNHPDCFISNVPGDIAEITFYVTDDTSYKCMDLPVRFLWRDCRDNAFSESLGVMLLMSQYVYDWEFHDPIHADDVFPTYKGAPDECITNPAIVSPVRKVDFTSARVNISCGPPLYRGDVNLNGIPNEIADFVLFQEYFLYGPSVFIVDSFLQIETTDVNADGLKLTLRDLIYLYRIIIGDAVPYPKDANPPMVDTVVLIQDTDAKTIRLFYPDTLAGAYLIFDGDITPVYSGEMDIAHSFDGLNTKVLITPPLAVPRQGFVEGQLFSYTGTGTLDSAEIANFYDTYFIIKIEITNAEPACGDVNYDGDINIGDLVYLISYIFKGGAPPYSLEAADVNCDDKTNFTDVIYLVEYFFRGGPIPCADCPR
jgi:hypothetical protein